MPAPSSARPWLVRFVIACYMALAAGLTTYPWQFSKRPHELNWAVLPVDVVGNVLFFLPFGWLLGRGTALSVRRAVLCGMFLSFFVELLQMFIPGRCPSFIDLTTNTLGTWLGVWLAGRLGLGEAGTN